MQARPDRQMQPRRLLLIPLLLILLLTPMSSCAFAEDTAPAGQTEKNKSLKIVAAIFPIYDWTRQILGDLAETDDLILLMDKGVDLHSFQPTVDDILNIADCDIFLYVGGTSDSWAEDALAEAPDSDKIVINLLEVLGDMAREEEIVEGMRAEAEEEDSEEIEYDEHVWLSLKNAAFYTQIIADALSTADPAGAQTYQQNAVAYIDKLTDLDRTYEETISQSKRSTLLFADRFPFRYLAEDYGLTYYAAFPGCSADTEASFETIVFLARKVDELGLPVVLILDGQDSRFAETVVMSTKSRGQEVARVDSMQSITEKDLSRGQTYLSIMEDNLEVFRRALN